MRRKILIGLLLPSLVIILGGLLPVYAQGPDEEETTASIAAAGRLNLTFEQLGYEARRVNQSKGTLWYQIDLPDNFQISPSGNYVDLVTSHFPPAPDKPSVLQVELNGRLLSTLPVNETNAISNTIRLDIPEGVLQTGFNSLRVDLDNAETCEEPGALIDVLIDNATTVSFGYQQSPFQTDLALYPHPFTAQGMVKIPVVLVLPDRPTAEDLSAAATIAAGLGQSTGGAIDLTAVLASNLDAETRRNSHLILIGEPDTNPLLSSLSLPLAINEATVQPEQGVLQEVVSPWNQFRLALVASGLDNAGVLKASHALNRQAHFLGMRGPVAIVLDLGQVSRTTAPRPSRLTLASLGYEDQIVYGAGPQDFTFDFTLPLGWRLEDLPTFVLKFAHADIIDPAESVLDVKLNGVPIGSTLLTHSNAIAGEITLSIPEKLLKTGRNRLEVGVEMNFPNGDKCQDLLDQRAWTVISSASELFLPFNSVDILPSLNLFPYPFSQNTGLEQTVFVLPDQSPPTLIADLMQLAVRLGSPVRNEVLSIQVLFASQVTTEVRNSNHLILLGRPTENAVLSQANDHLPQPFVPETSLLEPLAIDSVAFQSDPERSAGLLEIISSPWNGAYNLLAVTGTTDEGVSLAAQTLLGRTGRLTGNLAVVEPTADAFSTDTNTVSTYTIDTRPPAPPDEAASLNKPPAENDLVLLARRWWR